MSTLICRDCESGARHTSTWIHKGHAYCYDHLMQRFGFAPLQSPDSAPADSASESQ